MTKSILAFFLVVLFFSNILSQGALDGYFKGKNILDLAVSAGFQTANSYTGAKGDLPFERTLPMASIFAEYGVNDKFDVILTLPYINNKFQDLGAYAKVKMLDKQIAGRNFTLASGLGFSTPASKYETEILNAIGQRATQFHGHLIAQSNLSSHFTFQVQGAYHYALDPVPSSITASGKLIFTHKKWYLDAWYEYQKGQGDISYQGTVPFTSFRQFFVDYQRVGGVVYKGLENNWGVFVNASTIFEGMNTFNTTTVMVGFVKKFDFSKKIESKK